MSGQVIFLLAALVCLGVVLLNYLATPPQELGERDRVIFHETRLIFISGSVVLTLLFISLAAIMPLRGGC